MKTAPALRFRLQSRRSNVYAQSRPVRTHLRGRRSSELRFDCKYYSLGGDEDFTTRKMFRQPYLAVETYKPGECMSAESLLNASIHRLDENCNPNAAGTASHRLTLHESATLTIYTDASCTNVASVTTIPKEATEWT